MTAFGIGTNTNRKDITINEVQGKQVEVACDCWFSRKGKTIPQYIKYEDEVYRDWETDRKSTRLNSSHITRSRMPSSA